MISPLGFLLDEHLRGPLWDAIQAHNAKLGAEPILVFRVGDSPDLPLGTDDPDILQWAEQKGCIVVSCDRQTIARHFRDHIDAGGHSPGLVLLPNVFSIALVLEYLILAAQASEPTEWHDRIVYYS
jgi:hypothetical protein